MFAANCALFVVFERVAVGPCLFVVGDSVAVFVNEHCLCLRSAAVVAVGRLVIGCLSGAVVGGDDDCSS